MTTPPAVLDRKTPTDWEHVEKYPLTALSTEEIKPTPVIFGVNWYSAFDNPDQDEEGRFWIKDGNLGSIRGGHCLCAKSIQPDRLSWYRFYDQGNEGACVGFGISRAQTMRNRVMYDAFWLYHEAQKIDEWPGTDYDGTSVNAGLKVAKSEGLRRARSGMIAEGEGINAYRWATSVDDVHAALQLPIADKMGAIPWVNSWGTYYPHIVWVDDDVIARLLYEDGEAAVTTDR